MAGPHSEPRWTELPLTHPRWFTATLMLLPPRSLLACRATCSTWQHWVHNRPVLWSQYLARLLIGRVAAALASSEGVSHYHLQQLLALIDRGAGEAAALATVMRLERALARLEREQQQDQMEETMRLVQRLSRTVKVLGPPILFLRLKVAHPAVQRILAEHLWKYLKCIVLDKQDTGHEVVRRAVFQSMHRGQNWAYVNFSGCGAASTAADGAGPGDGSVVLHGEHNLQEALRLSLAPGPSQDPAPLQGGKRKAEQEQERPAAKKRKLNMNPTKTNEEDEESDEEDEESEDEEVTESEEAAVGAALYALPLESEEVKEFPTMLDLLEVDNEIVLDLLRERCQVDEHLVVPKFDEFLHHSALLASSCRLIGCDGDGKVQIVDPAAFRRGDGAELGYIESTQVLGQVPQLQVWTGPDLRARWPSFARQLGELDREAEKRAAAPAPAPAPRQEARLARVVEGDSGLAQASVPDLMSILAARGITVQRS